MNLKEAASRLGVHYQTAYKWVRSGELIAVRVGSRYEVSPAAIERFEVSRRVVVGDEVPDVAPGSVRLEPEDFLEALEALAMDPFVTVPSVAALVVRGGAEVLGDLCLVAHRDAEGVVDCLTVNHANPDEAARLAGALVLTGFEPMSSEPIARPAFTEQRIVRIPHVPQDLLRRRVKPELLQYLALHPIHSVLIAPVVVAGRSVGVVVFTRGAPSRPYSETDERYVERLAREVAILFETATEVETAWTARRTLVAALTELATVWPPVTPSFAELGELIERCTSGCGLPLAILDADGRLRAFNSIAGDIMGYPPEAVLGTHFESFTHPDELDAERANFERLKSGELDYLDLHARRLTANGTELAYASHRAAIRDPEATLRFVVSVSRPLHIAKEDYGALLTEPL